MTIRAMVVGFSLLSVFVLTCASGVAHAASASPGKTAVYASTTAAMISVAARHRRHCDDRKGKEEARLGG